MSIATQPESGHAVQAFSGGSPLKGAIQGLALRARMLYPVKVFTKPFQENAHLGLIQYLKLLALLAWNSMPKLWTQTPKWPNITLVGTARTTPPDSSSFLYRLLPSTSCMKRFKNFQLQDHSKSIKCLISLRVDPLSWYIFSIQFFKMPSILRIVP